MTDVNGNINFSKALFLTEREHEVLRCLGEGMKTGDISRQLSISTKTTDAHICHIREKTEIRNTYELRVFATKYLMWLERKNFQRVKCEPKPVVQYEFQPRVH